MFPRSYWEATVFQSIVTMTFVFFVFCGLFCQIFPESLPHALAASIGLSVTAGITAQSVPDLADYIVFDKARSVCGGGFPQAVLSPLERKPFP